MRSALSAKDMGEFLMPYPSKNEQQKICALIDNKTERISWLIFNVQAQIEKLKAYKQSLITEVVTKGLDPTAPMKDSGVEWIGEIPVSWGIAKLQYCAKIRSGITLGKKYPDDSELIERYLRVANVQNGGVVLDDLKTIEVSAEEDAQYRLSAGEVLMTEVETVTNSVVDAYGLDRSSHVCTRIIFLRCVQTNCSILIFFPTSPLLKSDEYTSILRQ